MPNVNVGELRKEAITLYDSDFTNGPDQNSSVSAGDIGTIAVAEVGEDGSLSSYDAFKAGQPASSSEKPQGNEVFVDLETATDGTDVDSKTEWRLAWRTKNENRREPLTRWFRVRETNDTDVRKRPVLPQGSTWVTDGRELVFEVKNESTSITVHLGNSDIELPAIAGY